MPTRVLLVGRGAPERGGIPTFLETVASADLGPDVRVELLNLGRAGVREGGRASGGNVARSAADARAVARTARRGDVVHLNTAFAPTVTAVRAGLLVLAARSRGARVVVHVHGGRVALWLTTPRLRRVAAAALRGAHVVVAVSQAVHDALAPVCGDRLVLLDNAVDTELFAGPPRGSAPPRVLFAGGLTARKGVGDLLEASRLLDAQGVAHELALVGGTPDEGAAAEQDVRAGAGPSARFLGPRPPADMPEVYRSADVFCLPSWYEAMPLSVLEAMACGLPVVATTVGDVPRMVDDGDSGLLVPPRDPAALAEALRVLLTAPERRARLGAQARRRVEERYAVRRLAADLRDLYTPPGGRP